MLCFDYCSSSIVRKVLCDAWNQGKKFKVIVVDARPKMEGKCIFLWMQIFRSCFLMFRKMMLHIWIDFSPREGDAEETGEGWYPLLLLHD